MFNNPKAITLTFSSLYPMGGLPLEPSVSTLTKESKKWFLSPFIFFLCHERIPTQRALFVTPWLPYTHHHFLQSVFILYLFFAFFLWGWDTSSESPLLLALPPRWFLFQRTQYSVPPPDCNHIRKPNEGCG